jgi:TM2 domain-containing membrane protein YozV
MDSASAMSNVAASAPSSGLSEKGFVPMILLCFFLGGLGIHRFYAGKIGTGILMLVTFGGFGIWTIVDFIMIVTGNFKDGEGTLIKAG